MKEEAKFLIEIADQFGDGAQNVLDFVAKTGNLEKASRALAKSDTPATPAAAPTILAPEASDIDKIPDGVYFIAGASEGHINTKTYAKYEPNMTTAPFPAKYIGVKLGHRAIAVALEDLPGDAGGELQLLPNTERCQETSDRYSWDKERDECRFNVFEDFDGEYNTKHLMDCGSKINLPDGEWIPSMGELGLLMMHATDVNKAIELAGGKPIKGWHWSSTENSQTYAWYVSFSDGYTCINNKFNSYAVRAVAAFF